MPAHLDVALVVYTPRPLENLNLRPQKLTSLKTIYLIMPLVVPGINSNMGDKSEWVNKLMGKKISETGSDEVVCLLQSNSCRLEVEEGG